MKTIILAGGFGTRLSEETIIKPKPMVEIGGMPILWHIMKTYSSNNYNDFIVALGYKGSFIKNYFVNYMLHKSDISINLKSGNINYQSDLDRLSDYKFDFIFHHAAISDTRVEDQEIVMRTNTNSFNHILLKAKKDNSAVIYSSSAATYGNSQSPQIKGREKPENIYGFSKYMMDQIASKFALEGTKSLIILKSTLS